MTTFNNITIGNHFFFDGTWWEKRSSRTAHVLGRPNRWFFFSKGEIVDLDGDLAIEPNAK